MNLSSQLVYNPAYVDVDADTDRHGYVDYVKFYDRVAVAAAAGIPELAVKPQYISNGRA